MKNKIITTSVLVVILMFLAFAPVYSQNIIVSTPIPIDPIVDLANSSDYAIYDIYVENLGNLSYNLFILPISLWDFKYNIDEENTIYPGETKKITVFMRPLSDNINEIPMLVLSFKSPEGDEISYTVTFSPTIIKVQEEVPPVEEPSEKYRLNVSIYLDKNILYPGDSVNLGIILYSNFNGVLNGYVDSDILPYRIMVSLDVVRGYNEFIVPLEVSKSILPGEYSLVLYLDNITKRLDVTITKIATNVTYIKENGEIIIKNNEEVPVYHEYKYPISIKKALFYEFYPKPDYYISVNDTTFAVWKLVLMPKEEFSIHIKYDYKTIFVFVLLLVLLIVYVVLKLFYPRVDVKKELIKVDPKTNTIKILITISNRGRLPVKDVKVVDKLLKIFEFQYSEFIKQSGVIEEKDYYRITWFINTLNKGEERVIVYTTKYNTEVVGEIKLDPAEIEYRFMNRVFKIKSNSLYIRFAK